LTTAGAGRVKVLYQQQYRILVRDSSSRQNFHLSGPGVNRKTSVARTTRTTWRLTLVAGTYVYRSDRSSRLRGTFVVRSIPPA
jgi:hypothetical protein